MRYLDIDTILRRTLDLGSKRPLDVYQGQPPTLYIGPFKLWIYQGDLIMVGFVP